MRFIMKWASFLQTVTATGRRVLLTRPDFVGLPWKIRGVIASRKCKPNAKVQIVVGGLSSSATELTSKTSCQLWKQEPKNVRTGI